MTEENPGEPHATPNTPPTPVNPPDAPLPPPERNRVEATPSSRGRDALPILYLIGFLILGAALVFLYRHPNMPRGAAQDAQRVITLSQTVDATRQQTDALNTRLTQLEARPAPPPPPDLTGIDNRIAALEARPAPAPPVDLAPIDARVKTLEDRQPTNLAPLEARIKALEDRPPTNLAPLQASIAAITSRLEQLSIAQSATQATNNAAATKTASAIAALEQRIGAATQLQSAATALELGQPLGDIPGAPPAVAKYAHDAPPTESSLRASFAASASAAQKANPPPAESAKPFLDRMWDRAQQSVTVRQGDHILIGDPIAGIIEHARTALDAGDLPGAVQALDTLTGPPKAAMAAWLSRAHALLDARAALAAMAAHG